MKISRGGLAALGLVCIMGASGIAHSTTQSQTQVAPWQQETYATQTIVAWEQQATATAQALTATAITPTPTQGGRIIPPPAGSGPNDRYYASGTPVATMISDASSLAGT